MTLKGVHETPLPKKSPRFDSAVKHVPKITVCWNLFFSLFLSIKVEKSAHELFIRILPAFSKSAYCTIYCILEAFQAQPLPSCLSMHSICFGAQEILVHEQTKKNLLENDKPSPKSFCPTELQFLSLHVHCPELQSAQESALNPSTFKQYFVIIFSQHCHKYMKWKNRAITEKSPQKILFCGKIN